MIWLGILLARGWRPNFDRSITDIWRKGKVENGTAYDRATVELGEVTTIILPRSVEVRRKMDGGTVELFMGKESVDAKNQSEASSETGSNVVEQSSSYENQKR